MYKTCDKWESVCSLYRTSPSDFTSAETQHSLSTILPLPPCRGREINKLHLATSNCWPYNRVYVWLRICAWGTIDFGGRYNLQLELQRNWSTFYFPEAVFSAMCDGRLPLDQRPILHYTKPVFFLFFASHVFRDGWWSFAHWPENVYSVMHLQISQSFDRNFTLSMFQKPALVLLTCEKMKISLQPYMQPCGTAGPVWPNCNQR